MTPLAEMDFETYSEAGYIFDDTTNKWKSIVKSPPHGLGAVGAPVYAEHPSTEVLCLAYNLHNGNGAKLWLPGMSPPKDLLDHIANGGLIEAWNSAFEFYIWQEICHKRMKWISLPYNQLRDAMAKSRAFSLPGKLKDAAKAINSVTLKIEDGKRLLDKFSKPRNPTKKDPRKRILPSEDLGDACRLYSYCLMDISTEKSISNIIPDLSLYELNVWLLDQRINFRGIAIDPDALENCKSIVDQATTQYTEELQTITNGTLINVDELDKMKGWIGANGTVVDSLDKDHIVDLLERTDLSPVVRRVLEIRQILGSASVKKLAAIIRQKSGDGRLRDWAAYCGAQRTGRFAGRGPQPHNLPAKTPDVGVDRALQYIATRNLHIVENHTGDALDTVSGCLRGLFVAAPWHDLICSDFVAIEAILLAFIAGEQWRMDVFNTHGKIYEMSASKITGIPFQEFLDYREEWGEHHPMRKKIGKYTELALGYQGWLGALKAFGADEYLTDDELTDVARKWREDSPAIVALWRNLEKAVISAIQNPGLVFTVKCLSYIVTDDILYCTLPSGRKLVYINPRLNPTIDFYGRDTINISYMGWNSDYKKGPLGWMRLETYGGKLTENPIQAIARDILVNSMLNVEASGYPIVLHVHDEIASEVPTGFGSLEEFERIMSIMPSYASDWPIKASGGWRGYRYRKD